MQIRLSLASKSWNNASNFVRALSSMNATTLICLVYISLQYPRRSLFFTQIITKFSSVFLFLILILFSHSHFHTIIFVSFQLLSSYPIQSGRNLFLFIPIILNYKIKRLLGEIQFEFIPTISGINSNFNSIRIVRNISSMEMIGIGAECAMKTM